LYDRTAGVTRSVKIAQIESRTQACLSMTEMQAITRSVNTLCIDAFGIRFGTSGHDRERVRDHDARLERSSPL
ncbi:MAG: hypothetical protein M0P13_04785, partial [Fibrobacteraceae bacterium]|nr:hypothetical protein [Fibrobacteraceae bacterium]